MVDYQDDEHLLPRQVDLMNKWKAVDTADEGLLSVRKQYQEKMVEFAERWSKVGANICFGVFLVL